MKRELFKEKTDTQHEHERELLNKKLKERREAQMEAIKTVFSLVSNGAWNVVNNPDMMGRGVAYSATLFAAYHFTKASAGVFASTLMAAFGKPQLVRETSRLVTRNYFALPYLYTRKMVLQSVRRTEANLLDGIILEKNLEDQIRSISYAVLNRKKHYAPCKNMMFYGPPGTGKTLFAKKLAMKSGLEYAVMVGSDIAPLGPQAVYELNKLFDWAEKQPNGMILFIDEADAFLRNRKEEEMSENMRHSINSFLYRTGTPSNKVILIMATNTPEDLDAAVHDRIDEVVGFGKPTIKERETMLFHYLVQYCKPPETA